MDSFKDFNVGMIKELTSAEPGWAAVRSSENAPASLLAASSNLSPSDSVSSSAASIRTSFENSPMFDELYRCARQTKSNHMQPY